MRMATAYPLLAEGPDLGGASGWAGAGMLGMVLFWLMYKHIPVLTAGYLEQIKDLTEAFERSLDKVVKHCEGETSHLAGVWKAEVDRLVSGMHSSRKDEADRITEAFESVRAREASELRDAIKEIGQLHKKPGPGPAKT